MGVVAHLGGRRWRPARRSRDRGSGGGDRRGGGGDKGGGGGDRHGGGWDGGGDVAEEAGTGTATGAVGKSPCGGRDRVGMRSLRDKVAVQIGLGLFYGPFM